jgi:protein-S-isoprenylcysteine O-methyltransferase Ste14
MDETLVLYRMIAAVNYLSHPFCGDVTVVASLSRSLGNCSWCSGILLLLSAGHTAGFNEEDDPVDVHGHIIVTVLCLFTPVHLPSRC